LVDITTGTFVYITSFVAATLLHILATRGLALR
jgi:hypothetical protein